MTTLGDRTRTALLVIDVQNEPMAGAVRRDEVIANIAGLVERARREDVTVVWVAHADEGMVEGSPGWQYVPELVRAPSEPLVRKTYGDSFEATDLSEVLAGLAVGRLVVVGAQTDACVRATLHGAIVRGYDATLVADAHTTVDLTAYGAPRPEGVITHTNLYWQGESRPGRRAEVVDTAEVDFAAP